ncbi:FAD-linked oxidoreductase [Epithele typhae]|uniref:FAD-linked oxidoreductase n=1 Tax=Epithele typhae TaxID=378194 RepID=UPI002008790D|nr:FAD-linked oxidoreductase [Epithele typhae]KAH9939019.1 FAD-linked oxidoreductase [Epithele typhae]
MAPSRLFPPTRLLTTTRSATRTPLSPRARLSSSATAPPRPRRKLRWTGLAAGAALATGALVFANDARAGANELEALHDRTAGSVGAEGARERVRETMVSLVRTYVVYSFCSVPALVDAAPAILDALLAVPGLRAVTEAVVRTTFFGQFVGGETAEDALPLIEELRQQKTGCLFAYSVEVDEAEASGHGNDAGKPPSSVHKQIVQETLHCIDVAADYEDKHTPGTVGRRTWVAIKLSAMVPDAETLRRFSKFLVDTRPPVQPPVAFPGAPLPSDLDVLADGRATGPLTDADIVALRELRQDLEAICARAKARGVRIIFDAEYSWYEPAIDAYTLDMMRRFNKLPSPANAKASWFGGAPAAAETDADAGVQPLVYATYQAYLRRTPEYLVQSIAAARREGYALGVKLVRGAYHPHEVAAHPAAGEAHALSLSISPEPAPPVWTAKAETDARYDAGVRALVRAVRADVEAGKGKTAPPTIGVLFGTHNWTSAELIPEEMARAGLARKEADGTVVVPDEVAERVTMGQLFGMTAVLTTHLANRVHASAPFVIKYIPYGALSEVMPYLGRRAIENKSVLGNGAAAEERRRAAAEIVARVVG